VKGLRAAGTPMDRGDPRCPDCGEAVSRTASFCIHCHADLDGRGDVDAAVVDLGDGTGSGTGTAPSAPAAGEEVADDRGWFHPDSLLDDASTALVGVVAGVVVGFLLMLVLLLGTGAEVTFLAWPVALVAVALYVGHSRTAFGAVRKACYLLAPTLVAVPLFWFGEAPEGGEFAGRVLAFIVSEAVVGPVALAVAGVGYWVGGRAPEL
jgi:hypothetical protein